MDLFDIAIARKLSGGSGGGGGSSDFTTAQVTVVNSAQTDCFCMLPVVYEANDEELTPACSAASEVYIYPSSSETVTVSIYKGLCICSVFDVSLVEATGDAVVVAAEDMFNVLITGDCTITIS